MARPRPRSAALLAALAGAAGGVLAALVLPLAWVALVVVATLVVALVLQVRRVESGRRGAVSAAPFFAAGLGGLVTRLVVELGLLGGVVAVVVLAVAVLVLGGDIG